MENLATAYAWINAQETYYARTIGEKAKYLQGKLTGYELPHPVVWHEVLKIVAGLRTQTAGVAKID